MCTQELIQTAPTVAETLREACKKIAPVWPLESFVAVNPYFGMGERTFAEVAERLCRVAGARTTMPLSYYAEALSEGRFTEDDVLAAAEAAGIGGEALLAALRQAGAAEPPAASVPTVADVATDATDDDWSRLVVERVSAWASAYFDEGQSLWSTPFGDLPPFAAWRAEATVDRTPEVMGVAGFRTLVKSLPAEPLAAAEEALKRLAVPKEGMDLYLHRLLMRVGGWASYAARVVWDKNLYEGEQDDCLLELLCVLLVWEVALLEALGDRGVKDAWSAARERLVALSRSNEVHEELARELALQDAFERGLQRGMVGQFAQAEPAPTPDPDQRPAVQAVFCIDVRSEVFRRHFEAADERVETLGFAGFFAFPVAYRQLGHGQSGYQCPVLLTPACEIEESLPDAAATEAAVEGRSLSREVKRAWQSFKMGAVSCFSFVGPIGLAYLPKLFTDGFGLTRPVPHPAEDSLEAEAIAQKGPNLEHCHHGDGETGIPLESRIELAAGALGAMSLTKGFARVVLITGHGSTTVNNPHATGLDCGACGGRTGEANARVAAKVLNDPAVREGLKEKGIVIPDDTVFVAAQHDTTKDEIAIFDRHEIPESHRQDIADIEGWAAVAGRGSRAERASRLHLDHDDVDGAVLARSRDWSQTRPEWGLAGCSAFIVAPRHRTAGLDFGGRSFLHSYAWQQDDGFGVLELIMTAPMVVASWISLQYYASTVEPKLFGAGNKTLHNVVGSVGVLEGNAGDLRIGLPWQSVHDGEALQHDPVRLNVIIEAPIEAMNAIIEKHELVKNLLDNGWLHLFWMDEHGKLAKKYAGGLQWTAVAGAGPESAAAA